MTNATKSLILLLTIIFVGQTTAQNTKKVWIEAGQGTHLIIPMEKLYPLRLSPKTECA